MTALLGSCVEIPCTFYPARAFDTSSTLWFLHKQHGFDPEIFNTEDSSSVTEKYRNRTSLVPGDNSCTLRIDPVRWEDDGDIFYPAIAGYTFMNAYEEKSGIVSLRVIDTVNIQLNVPKVMNEGEATTIRCAINHTCGSSPPDLQWNKPGQIKKNSVKLEDGSWTEESVLTYIPSAVDDGSDVLCTAEYPNIVVKRGKSLNILCKYHK
ncbi:hypothetical protein GDO81_028616 [Engystomops pustulosus]|uniref:Ig-like domain-containing protein n=1 Tax=Engystomops pustulosus TaxID=76066 RepID=A0AAV6ZL40_ENGPU|nr:hypothetical protein GDO81_028616 [Engystomops pustulosus]